MFALHIVIASATVYISNCHVPVVLFHHRSIANSVILWCIVFLVSIFLSSSLYLSRIGRRAKVLNARLVPASTMLPFTANFYFMRHFGKADPGKLFTCVEPRLVNDPKTREQHATFNIKWNGVYSLFTKDPQIISQMISSQRCKDFGKDPVTKRALQDFLGTRLPNCEYGNDWKFQRNLVIPFFSKERLTNLKLENIDKLITLFSKHAESGEPVDVFDAFMHFTFDNSLDFFTGYGQGSFDAKNDYNTYYDAFAMAERNSIIAIAFGSFRPLLEFFPSLSVKKPMATLRTIVDQIIDKELESKNIAKEDTDKISKRDCDNFLQYLVTQTDDRQLIQELTFNLLFAARDSSAALFSTALYVLSENPQVYKEMRDEVIRLIGVNGVPDQGKVRGIKLIRAVLMETLRMYPGAPLTDRYSKCDSVLTSSNGERYFIPQSTKVIINFWLLQRDPSLWGDDSEKWDPYRWLDSRYERVTSNPAIFQPFGMGPRICPGQELAYQLGTLFLIRFCQTFERVERAKDVQQSVLPTMKLTVYWKNGMWLRMIPSSVENV